MEKTGHNIFKFFIRQPKLLFLADGIGAMLTALTLFIVQLQHQSLFGVQTERLFYLSIAACFMSIFSLGCYCFIKRKWSRYFKIIILANILYCMFTLGILIANFHKITLLGAAYFLMEILIISFLVLWEIKLTRTIQELN